MPTSYLTQKRLTRSPDGYLAGVCEGIAQYLNIDATLIRVAWLVAAAFFGTGILLYIVLWWVLPEKGSVAAEPVHWQKSADGSRHPALERTVVDRKILGVCGGVARRLEIDPAFVRLGALALLTVSFGLVVFIYLLAAFFIPSSDEGNDYHPVEL